MANKHSEQATGNPLKLDGQIDSCLNNGLHGLSQQQTVNSSRSRFVIWTLLMLLKLPSRSPLPRTPPRQTQIPNVVLFTTLFAHWTTTLRLPAVLHTYLVIAMISTPHNNHTKPTPGNVCKTQKHDCYQPQNILPNYGHR